VFVLIVRYAEYPDNPDEDVYQAGITDIAISIVSPNPAAHFEGFGHWIIYWRGRQGKASGIIASHPVLYPRVV
jgi:hypothetical protein